MPPRRLPRAPHRCAGTLRIGGQEHFYLEGQVALAVPGEDGAVLVYSSTQHPSEVQHIVARVLGVPDSFVTCRVRRMGGGFGGKETQATQWAVIAALAARATGRAVQVSARPRRRHGDDRQAARFRGRIFRRLRCQRPHSRGRSRSRRALRLLGRLPHRRGRSRHVPLRQRVFSAGIPHPYRAASKPTPCRTPRSAASAARRACWRSSA